MKRIHLLSVFNGEDWLPLSAFVSPDDAQEAKRQHLHDEPFRCSGEYRIQSVELHD